MLVALEEMKKYLRVDFNDDDALIENFITTGQNLCTDIARLSADEFEKCVSSKIAVMYAVAYLYEHREKVITGKNTRLSYFHGWEPTSINGGPERYSVSVLIPKDDKETIKAINDAVDAAIEEGIAKFGGKKPNKAAIKLPLRDGDTEREDEAYAGHWFINANSKTAPQIVDKAVKPILDRDEVYSGCYARVSLNFYAFNSNGNKGIACGLGNIQKIRDGESLGGRSSATDDFSTEEDDDFLS